ncbi:Cell wall-associated hydrolase, NlpC family [Salegentibacter holothuriorum]|uniref:Cell wall-associated hydrolase, NlpC family n=1 Tax=Salegentibacter holothuriorum TaxID=241145 RepID=A0A1T5BWU3_9FLAO|nr:C40 family peptidase [Salegentibacter holothuriorum]SKB51597.1 Cell wall-associated hydrolase, NlpC family [Salegentibacter holothuriorum]
MKLITIPYLTFLLTLFLFASCEEKKEEKEENPLQNKIAEVKENYAPDGRVALFEVTAEKTGETYILKGESNNPEAVTSLKEKLESQNIKFTDSIQVLPDTKALEDKIRGVVKISVANLRDEPKHSAQLVTQATLGMPLKVYKKQGGWYYVQTPEGYLAWVDYGGIENMTKEEFSAWKSQEKLIFTEPTGNSYSEANSNSQTVSDLVAGNVLELLREQNNFYWVAYPNGKKAFVEKAYAQPYQEWVASLEQNKEDLVATANKLMGLPYLWGGTSSKGVDCSGYTKTIYFLNGMVIPRDASQQIRTGDIVDSDKNFENLEKGDLLFFGKPATDSTSERVIHVGMWIGDNKFIHSMGEVHISNFDTEAEDFDEYNYNRYLRSKRILNKEDKGLIYLKNTDLFTTSEVEEVKM